MEEPQNQHVVPAFEAGRHNTDSLECPCSPEVYKPCDECEESTGGSEGCWKCQGDGVLYLQPGDGPPFVVLHGFVDLRLEAYQP